MRLGLRLPRPLAPRRPRLLLVGAYERDNVGDLLLLQVTERYLQEAEVVAAAPFKADMRTLLDREVPAYGPLLEQERFDVVWTVGGQVGSIDVRRAFRMSAPPARYRRFNHAGPERRERMLRRAVGGSPPPVAPYIPMPTGASAGALTVINSAGLYGIAGAEPARRRELEALVRRAGFITVRDPSSSAFLQEIGVGHELAPDAVHALSRQHPVAPDPACDVAIVQVSAAIMQRLGHDAVAQALAGAQHLRGLRVRFLAAGTATGHDRFSDFADVAARMRALRPDADVDLILDRRPLDLATHIARARVVVGTSLHVRIVAAAYGVARVTLERRKPTRYARAWDPEMPFGVALPDLDAAVGRARLLAQTGDRRGPALAQQAHEHLEALSRRVLASVAAAPPAGRRRDHPGG